MPRFVIHILQAVGTIEFCTSSNTHLNICPHSNAHPCTNQNTYQNPNSNEDSNAPPTPTPGAIVISNGLNVREGPGTEYSQQGQFSQNEELDVVGQFGDCAWLKVSSRNQRLSGWVSGAAQYIDLRTNCSSIPAGTFRPLTGIIKPNQRGGGHGELTVDNGTAKDGMVILTLAYISHINS